MLGKVEPRWVYNLNRQQNDGDVLFPSTHSGVSVSSNSRHNGPAGHGAVTTLRLFSGGGCEVIGPEHVARTPAADGSAVVLIHEDHAESSSIYLRSDGIMVSIPGSSAHIAGKAYDYTDATAARARGAAFIKASGWRLRLIDSRRVTRHTAQARRVEPHRCLDALAILVGPPMTRVGVALWVRDHRFDYPVKVFTDPRAAIDWLTIHRKVLP